VSSKRLCEYFPLPCHLFPPFSHFRNINLAALCKLDKDTLLLSEVVVQQILHLSQVLAILLLNVHAVASLDRIKQFINLIFMHNNNIFIQRLAF
jgi:hypothetical protein